MASTSRGTRSRQAIVTAGAELFAQRGFITTSINDVLDKVGLTKGAFYFHFATKEELAHAVCAGYHEWLTGLQDSVRADEPEPLRRVPKVLLEAAVAYRRDPFASATTRLLEESNQLDLPHLSPVWVPWWTETLTDARASGQLAPDLDIARFAWTLTAAWYGAQANSHAESNWVRFPSRLADLLRFVLLPAVTCPSAANQLRDDVEELPHRARRLLGERPNDAGHRGGAAEHANSSAGTPDTGA